jgi:Bacterial Ig-like domain/Beta-propeller repeat
MHIEFLQYWVLMVVMLIAGCSGGGGDDAARENLGWVTITEPTEDDSYKAGAISTITLSGETFISPLATATYIDDCPILGCILTLGQICYCNQYTKYDSGIEITITNHTNGELYSFKLISIDEGYKSHWSTSINIVRYEQNRITVSSKDEAGNYGEDEILVYAVDNAPPIILSYSPIDNSRTSVTGTVSVTFDKAITVPSGGIKVTGGSGPIEGSVIFSNENRTASFTPNDILSYDTEYSVTLDSLIKDEYDNYFAGFTWKFKTYYETWQLGSTSADTAYSIAVDDYGRSFLTGVTRGDLVEDGSDGSEDAFIASYDINGNKSWVKELATPLNEGGRAITVGNDGDIYVTGYRYRSLPNTTSLTVDYFLSKYDPEGNQLWLVQPLSDMLDSVSAIVADMNNNIYVTGTVYPNPGFSRMFIAKYDSDGNLQWNQEVDTERFHAVYDIDADSSGNIYIAASILGSVSTSYYDIYVTSFDADGNLRWANKLSTGDYQSDYSKGISVDNVGDSYIAASSTGDLAGNGVIGSSDIYLIKHDKSGNLISTQQIGTTSSDDVESIVLDASGSIYITGTTSGELSRSADVTSPPDIFIAKYNSSGTELWIVQPGYLPGTQGSYDIAIDSIGNSYITGHTTDDVTGNNSHVGSNDVFVMRLAP